jgi:hypothetical protein
LQSHCNSRGHVIKTITDVNYGIHYGIFNATRVEKFPLKISLIHREITARKCGSGSYVHTHRHMAVIKEKYCVYKTEL